MLDKSQRYIVGQARNALKSGKYGWAKGRCAINKALIPVEIEAEDAHFFDIYGLVDRVNFDNDLVAKRISPIFAEFQRAIVAGSIGDPGASNLQQWNDSPDTLIADVLLLLDIVLQTGTPSPQVYVAVAA